MNHPVLDINDQVEVIAGMIADEPEAFALVITDLSVAFTGITVQIGIPGMEKFIQGDTEVMDENGLLEILIGAVRLQDRVDHFDVQALEEMKDGVGLGGEGAI